MTAEGNESTTCAYCREGANLVTFDGREHVIPQAFGHFRDSLIARGVCDQCNTYFGRELDLVLARGSYEGVLRFTVGGKPATEYKHVGKATKVRTTTSTGPWAGLHLDRRPGDDGLDLQLTPPKQIGLSARADEEPEYHRVEGTPTLDQWKRAHPGATEVYIKTVGFDSPEETREALERLGYQVTGDFEPNYDVVTDGTTVLAHDVYKIDDVIQRAVAKIAFNYLIATSPAVARMPEFDQVRSFIRCGDAPSFKPVATLDQPILCDEPRDGRRLGHIVLCELESATNTVVARVSLYNLLQYFVRLSATGFATGFMPATIASGHFFDTANKVATPLTHNRMTLLIVPRT